MSTLQEKFARLIVERGEKNVDTLLTILLEDRPTQAEYQMAFDAHDNDEHTVDDADFATISRGEDGYWISGQMWVRWPQCDDCAENHDPRMECNPDDLHVAYYHPLRRGIREPQLWNIAADYVVNGMIDSQLVAIVGCRRSIMATSQRQRHIQALKDSRAYRNAREASLSRLVVETPDCHYLECVDCCWLERDDVGAFPPKECPECGGRLVRGWIRNGEVITK